MSVFASKLDRLVETVSLCETAEIADLGSALRSGLGGLAIAIGSGGSATVAEYLAQCRSSLGARTIVETPMQFTLEEGDLEGIDVWIFSARGENADIRAALRTASIRGAGRILIVTSNPDGSLALEARTAGHPVFICPVVDPKDGFLATHSLIAAMTMLLRASDRCASRIGATLGVAFKAAATEKLSAEARGRVAAAFAALRPHDTMLLLADPRLAPAATFLETSLWEAALSPVQRTDFRNFAHGRHVWLARNPESTFFLTLTGSLSEPAWSELRSLAPAPLREATFDYGLCGRFENAIAIIEALVCVEAIGAALKIDPAKPGHGSFAAAMYESVALEKVAAGLNYQVRQKRSALLRSSAPEQSFVDLSAEYEIFRRRLATTHFRGLVLDYDGTVVTTDGRFEPPETSLLDEITRLIEAGTPIGIATGRGGSVGEDLRRSLQPELHKGVLLGYYNGSHIRTLDIDIRDDPAPPSEELRALSIWLAKRANLFRDFRPKDSSAQVSIVLGDLVDVDAFLDELTSSDLPRVRWARSAHTLDFFGEGACKTHVAVALAERSGSTSDAILCIGDSGQRDGNDHLLLGLRHGISVGEVCDRPDVCWSLFERDLTGPAALQRILRAIVPVGGNTFQIDFSRLQSSG